MSLTVENLCKALNTWNKLEDIDGSCRYYEIFADSSCRIQNNITDSQRDFLTVNAMYDYIQNQVQSDMKVAFTIPSSVLRKAKLGDNSELAIIINTAMTNAVKDWENCVKS